MSDSKLLRGTFVLTLGTYVSRILGMIYLFPFAILVGTVGGALFGYGYNQYAIYLSIATAGMPMAVSKFVSKYNALGDYYTSRRMYRAGMKLMLVTGILAFLLLYSLAPVMSRITLGGSDLNNSLEDVVMVMRMVSVALIVVPMMSLMRGFFQGHQSMGPTAVSQVVEQLVRVVFLLASTYIVIKVVHGSLALAVGFATMGAFVGALAGLAVLIWYWKKRKPYLDKMVNEQTVTPTRISTVSIFKELLTYSLPYVFVSLAIPLYQYVDQFTFNRAMVAAGQKEIAESMNGIVQSYVPKLVMIPVSLATAFGLTLVPTITRSFVNKDYNVLQKQIDQTYQTIMFLVLPASVGLMALAGPAYTFFFGTDASDAGGNVLLYYAPVALLFSFFTVNGAILQGINKQKYAVLSLLFGLIVKIVVNVPFILMFHEIGSVLATALGYIVSLVYMFVLIQKHAKYNYSEFIKRSVLILIFVAIMGISVKIVAAVIGLFTTPGRFSATVITIIGAAVGGLIYFIITYRSSLLEKVMGARVTGAIERKILRRNKQRSA
ncbi:polysaccharide biosynthesis protein [Priestia megaterium]|uniref:Putative cell division protein ytgP n=1 Tax=Priestia megaterium (strain ATCC 14581 / DSM 32 / CCUG 1817 / JCM 2506 / NBRC 15308 / NCIMB 9376 / NCTC 10342 / NRRL B-14308 / VKM B-512 / Ford 19) TaxID=1348623 RepID=A0A0B6AW59_PRIM2|nr:polysaccharide biosynthesis protein [Priestia megaterium]AJI25352.1 putative cell division protein ytgP [Priestia megaterium NBRC 15308 = ATCC 14581]KFN00344.1 putative cell division protein ytgP [Priestia megaterium]KGJ86107.1 cell division protein [Priestia megaterium NBRC 15308 = ATCC 14581]MDH3184572.1 polysaccharide biosynthesis protein [Priestia megaterium]MDR4230077.1 polysaccharide biosynthesis protein [Priestia megaterium]